MRNKLIQPAHTEHTPLEASLLGTLKRILNYANGQGMDVVPLNDQFASFFWLGAIKNCAENAISKAEADNDPDADSV